jgi:tetratricopeptide (TPR) repeat protein
VAKSEHSSAARIIKPRPKKCKNFLRENENSFLRAPAPGVAPGFSVFPGAGSQNALCPRREIAYNCGVTQPRRIALLLALATLALYLPVAWSGFCLYDDSLYVTENPMVQQGVTWAGLKWAFTTMAASNWHPLTWLSLMIDCGVFGLNPAGPHLVNALFHAANAAVLFVLLLQLANCARWGKRNTPVLGGSPEVSPRQHIWPAALIAALFAWHPMHVESVAWISERKDVLSTFFALLSVLAYAKHVTGDKCPVTTVAPSGASSPVTRHPTRYYWLSLVCFALSLMAKPMLVTLPCVLLLLDFWPLHRVRNAECGLRSIAKLIVEKIPFFAITAASCLVTFLAQSQAGGKAVVSLALVPLNYRLKNVPVAYAEYLWKTFWPAKLAIFYPLPDKIPAAQAAAAALVLLAISLFALRLRRSRPYLLTGWLWFLGMLVPVIGLVQVGSAQIADRYTYLPSVGIFIILTFAALDLSARWQVPRKVLAVAAFGILTALVVATEMQLSHWQNNVALFRHALAVTTDNDVIRNNLGIALERQGKLDEAVEQYRTATRLYPDRYLNHHNLANALDRLNRHDEALAAHRVAVKLGPNVQFLHHRLGLALLSAGRMEEARNEFAEAARLDAHTPWPQVELAKLDLQQSRDTQAVDKLRAAVRIAPENADILAFVARVLASSEATSVRDGQSAFALAAKANLLTGGARPEVLDIMGMACAEMGRFDEAQMAAQQALDLATAAQMKNLEPIQQRIALYRNHQPWRESLHAAGTAAKD